MESDTQPRVGTEVEAAIAMVHAAIDALAAVAVSSEDPAAATDVLREFERAGRRVRCVQIAAAGQVAASRVYRTDGHKTAKAMITVGGRLSHPEAQRRVRSAHAFELLAEVRAEACAGRIPSCHLDRIGRLCANPRITDEIVEQDHNLAVLASRLAYDEFDERITAWERTVDVTGTADQGAAAHRNRDLRLAQEYDGGWALTGRCGSVDGIEANAILSAFVDAEFHADWDAAKATHEDATTVAHLCRTDAQRRWDAFQRILRLAADAHAAAPGGSKIITDILIDQHTFEAELTRLAGLDPTPRNIALDISDLEVRDLEDRDAGGGGGMRPSCRDRDGHHADPRQVVAQALLGHVRRVVLDAASVVIDLGRTQRLFTGNAKLAATLGRTHCPWPGCRTCTSRAQIDHLHPWRAGGPTDQANAAPTCGHHNRHKDHGYTVRKDQRGRLHTLRPDGTEIDP